MGGMVWYGGMGYGGMDGGMGMGAMVWVAWYGMVAWVWEPWYGYGMVTPYIYSYPGSGMAGHHIL